MCLGGDIGAEVEWSPDGLRPDLALFSESNTRWVLEARGEPSALEGTLEGLPLRRLGRVGGSEMRVRIGNREFALGIEAMRNAWSGGMTRLVAG
jgi:phosphoribosylformylglycinamidine synthase